jgi:hypothetical protein
MIKTTNLLQWRRVQILSATFFCITLALVSCKKKDTSIGKDVLDPNSMLNSQAHDTFELETYTVVSDSIKSSNSYISLLGSYNDPQFGKFDAQMYTQIRLSASNPNFGTLAQLNASAIDSFVLGLQYKGYYGKLTPQTFSVHQLGESLDLAATYYSTDSKTTTGGELILPGFETQTPRPSGGTVIGADTFATLLRIPLDTNLARTLMTEAITNTSTFANNDNFLAYFKGLKIQAVNPAQSSGQGGILYFDMTAALSKVTIYYTDYQGSKKTFDFVINKDCADFNHIDIDNTGKRVEQVISNHALGQSEFYAQAYRSRAVVEFPSLSDIPKNSVIHTAKLTLPISHYTGSSFYPSLVLNVGTNKEGSPVDSIFNTGIVAQYDDALKAYTIDLRAYAQYIVNGKLGNFPLYFVPAYSELVTLFNASSERIIFNGPESVNKKKPKLSITYTTY